MLATINRTWPHEVGHRPTAGDSDGVSCSGSLSDVDAPLLALTSELEAAARPYLAYNRDAEVSSADPDCEEARAHGRLLYDAVNDVSERIFAIQPHTIAGLLVIAHAASVVAEERWEEEPQHLGHDGRLLRLVLNGLFRLVGVDWRGRSLPNQTASLLPRSVSSSDATLILLAEAAIAEERAALAISQATNHDVPPGTFARSMQLLELVTATDARTLAGVAAKARLLLTHASEEDDIDGDWRCQAMALSLARDAARLGVAE